MRKLLVDKAANVVANYDGEMNFDFPATDTVSFRVVAGKRLSTVVDIEQRELVAAHNSRTGVESTHVPLVLVDVQPTCLHEGVRGVVKWFGTPPNVEAHFFRSSKP
jgi:hypothetical protein